MHILVATERRPITNARDGGGRWWRSSTRPKYVQPIPSTARLVIVAGTCHVTGGKSRIGVCTTKSVAAVYRLVSIFG